MAFENVLLEQEDNLAIITVNRPKQLNALNRDTIKELNQALNQVDEDEKVRVVIITGAGDKAFVAGADIKEFSQFSVEDGKALSAEGHKLLFDRVEQMTKPVIAAVNGFALGGGLELAMAAHMRIGSENARLGLPEVSLGVIPGYGGTQRLAQLAGKGKAMEMITSAGMITADEAKVCGLLNNVVPQEDLMNACKILAGRISKNSPRAISAALSAVLANYQDGVNGFDKEIEEFGKCFGTEDFKEGTTAFLNKSKPNFTGK